MKRLATSSLIALTVLAVGPAVGADALGNVARGKLAFDGTCAICHGPEKLEGRNLPGTSSLQVKYRGAKPPVLADRTDLPAAYVIYVVRHGEEGMPFFRPTEVSSQTLRDIAAYLSRNTK